MGLGDIILPKKMQQSNQYTYIALLCLTDTNEKKREIKECRKMTDGSTTSST